LCAGALAVATGKTIAGDIGIRRKKARRAVAQAWLWLFLFPALASAQSSSGFDDLVAQASSAREQNDIPTAIERYTESVQLKPDWPEGWWYLGVLQYGTGAYAQSRDALTHYIELTPTAGPAFAVRGLCEFEIGEYPQSLRDIEQGLSLGAANQSRNESTLRYHRALLLTLDGDFEGALRDFAFVAKDGVSDPQMILGIGLAGLRKAMLPKDVPADQRDLYFATGNAAFRFMAGDDSKGQQEFEDLFRRFPAAANAHYFLGYLLFSKDKDRAVIEFRRELETTPSNVAAQTMVAWDLLLRNEPAEAMPFAEKAAAAGPASPSAQLVLGRALVETGRVNDGMGHLDRALQLDPENVEVHFALVRGYSELGRKEDAQRERLRCIEMTKSESSAVVHP
jgi:tetratricopeptide (TPR) repeat protein